MSSEVSIGVSARMPFPPSVGSREEPSPFLPASVASMAILHISHADCRQPGRSAFRVPDSAFVAQGRDSGRAGRGSGHRIRRRNGQDLFRHGNPSVHQRPGFPAGRMGRSSRSRAPRGLRRRFALRVGQQSRARSLPRDGHAGVGRPHRTGRHHRRTRGPRWAVRRRKVDARRRRALRGSGRRRACHRYSSRQAGSHRRAHRPGAARAFSRREASSIASCST